MGLLSRIFAPRAEVIATSQDLDLFLRLGSAGPTAAGIAVTPEMAMRATAVFACVRILAESVAQLPLILYRRSRDGRKERAADHPLYQMTRRRPNQWMTSYEWREMMQGHLALRGNAYNYLVRLASQGGRVAEMLPIHPDRVEVEQDERWRLIYRVTMPDGIRREFGPEQILHLRGLSPDGVLGYSPIHLHREAIGYSLAAERHGAKLFSNGAAVGGVASHPGKLSDTAYDRLKKSIREEYAGHENAFKSMILEEGMTWQTVGLSSKDAQYLESRKFQKTEIATIFRIPPHMIADLERATFSNIEHQSLEFVKYTLDPWLRRWEERLTLDLLSEQDRAAGYFFEFLVEEFLRGDSKGRAEFYKIALGGTQNPGFMTPNEVRAKENLPPIADGDRLHAPKEASGDAQVSAKA